MGIDLDKLVNILDAALLVAGRPMTLNQFEHLFNHEDDIPSKDDLRAALTTLADRYEGRGIELVEVASGFRLQARDEFAPWIANLYQEKTPRYSRALVETLVLIAYRQPITRGEIEDVRGVAVSSNIIKTLLEREWIKILGHRDVPGRPAILGTTRQFLDYFNLKRIDDLPTLSEIKDLDQIDPELAKEMTLLESNADAEAAAEVDGAVQDEVTVDESTEEDEPLDESSQNEATLDGAALDGAALDGAALEGAALDTAHPIDESEGVQKDDGAANSDLVESVDISAEPDTTEDEATAILELESRAEDHADDAEPVLHQDADDLEENLNETSSNNLNGPVDVHLEFEDSESANDETLAPDSLARESDKADGSDNLEASEDQNSDQVTESEIVPEDVEQGSDSPTVLQVVGESETLH